MIKHFWLKNLITIPTCFITLSQADVNLLYGIVLIVILDTVLGLWKGLKTRNFTSHKMSKFCDKTVKYSVVLGSFWIVSRLEPTLYWSFHYAGIFLILTELVSILENLSELGMKLPMKLISKINSKYEELLVDNSVEK